jgi:hypothetical protein
VDVDVLLLFLQPPQPPLLFLLELHPLRLVRLPLLLPPRHFLLQAHSLCLVNVHAAAVISMVQVLLLGVVPLLAPFTVWVADLCVHVLLALTLMRLRLRL